jgi:hypothetical protein
MERLKQVANTKEKIAKGLKFAEELRANPKITPFL